MKKVTQNFSFVSVGEMLETTDLSDKALTAELLREAAAMIASGAPAELEAAAWRVADAQKMIKQFIAKAGSENE